MLNKPVNPDTKGAVSESCILAVLPVLPPPHEPR